MGSMNDLFPPVLPSGIFHLTGKLDSQHQSALIDATRHLSKSAEFSHPTTKSGGTYSAEITNCGQVGWWSDVRGYRYTEIDPRSGRAWPDMPKLFLDTLDSILSETVAEGFEPDACLINHYVKGAKMGLHQDKDERDFSHPIVTVSLGAAADFLIGGLKRSDPSQVILVESGDVLIMGGESRMRFHGIRKIYPGSSPIAGVEGRLSLTFRKAL